MQYTGTCMCVFTCDHIYIYINIYVYNICTCYHAFTLNCYATKIFTPHSHSVTLPWDACLSVSD